MNDILRRILEYIDRESLVLPFNINIEGCEILNGYLHVDLGYIAFPLLIRDRFQPADYVVRILLCWINGVGEY